MLKTKTKAFLLLEMTLCIFIICSLILVIRLTIPRENNKKIEQDQLIVKVKAHMNLASKTAFLTKKIVFVQYSKIQNRLTIKTGNEKKIYLTLPEGYFLEIPKNEIVIKSNGYIAPQTINLKGDKGFDHAFKIQMMWGEIYD